MSSFPPQISQRIEASFCDPERSAYGQIATINPNGFPEVRTVHFHYLPTVDRFAFGCHIESFKWRDLTNFPALSGCYFDAQAGVQFRFQADTDLVHDNTSDVLDQMWRTVRADVRAAYWLDHLNLQPNNPLPSGKDVAVQAPGYAVVLCMPRVWDIYELDPEDYRKGKRTLYTLKGDQWQSRPISILHSRDIRF